jgi:hypothetical protein
LSQNIKLPSRASDNMTTEQLQAQWGELFGALSNALAAGDQDACIETLDRLGEARAGLRPGHSGTDHECGGRAE